MGTDSQVKSSLSFVEAVEKAKQQINLECFEPEEKEMVQEIIFIVAEIYMLRDSSPIKISGEQIDAYIVKQVFEEIREHHVRLVMENFGKIRYIVNFKKAYLRTALYNAVFEYETAEKNRFNSTYWK